MTKKNEKVETEQTVVEETPVVAEETTTEVDLAAEVELANKRADEMKGIAQRVQADFENYRKRNTEAVKDARQDGENNMLCDMLGVLDSFERAMSQLTDEKTKADVSQIYKQFSNFFATKGIEEIEALGQEFNPQFHNAVMTVEDKENEGKIVDVLMKGYKRGNKVLRLPVVKVAK